MANSTRPTLTAEPRTGVGRKSELRALRHAGRVPGSIFGHGEPRNITVSARDVRNYLHHHAAGGILSVRVEEETTPALIREMDRDPLSGDVIHLGFQRVDLAETIR